MTRPAAFFDVDGTLVASNIVRYGIEIRTQRMSPFGRRAWTAAYLPRVPWLLALDAVSREAFQRSFYRIYAGLDPDELARRAERLFEEFVRPRIRPQAAARVAFHRDRGDQVALVSGSVEPIVRPLASHLRVDEVLAARLETREGRTTGGLENGALAGERKAEVVAGFAAERGVDLSTSYGYADSSDDVPMLERIGHPAVVNPGRKLERLARARGWDVYRWPAPADFGLRPA
jgi:HAD superfamily hydrolase (TIGR01490 family)